MRLNQGLPALVLFSAFVALPAHPQRPPAQPVQVVASGGQSEYTLRTRVPLTIVDVTVTDAKGNPVRGLKESDFTVLEDSQPMKLNSFTERRSDEAASSAAPPTPQLLQQLPPNSFSNIIQEPVSPAPPTLLLLDSLNTPMGVQTIVRNQMAEYVKKMPEGTRVAIFTLTTRLAVAQGFTSDRDTLLAVLQKGDKAMPQFALLEDSGQDPMQNQDASHEAEANRMAARAEKPSRLSARSRVTSPASLDVKI